MRNTFFLLLIITVLLIPIGPKGSMSFKTHLVPPANQGAIDVNVTATCTIRVCSSSAFSTSANNELVLLGIYEGSSGTGVASISDAAGLIFQDRVSPLTIANILVIDEWFTFTTGLLSSDIVTITLSGPASFNWNFVIVTISGSYANSPFDIPNAIQAKGSSCTGWPTFTLQRTPEMMLGFAGSSSTSVMTVDPGFVAATTLTASLSVEYQIFNSIQQNVQVSFNQKPCAGGANWGVIIEIICVNTLEGCNQAGRNPTQNPIQSVSGPGGLPVPPQLADTGTLSFISIISALILASSINIQREKKNREGFA